MALKRFHSRLAALRTLASVAAFKNSGVTRAAAALHGAAFASTPTPPPI